MGLSAYDRLLSTSPSEKTISEKLIALYRAVNYAPSKTSLGGESEVDSSLINDIEEVINEEVLDGREKLYTAPYKSFRGGKNAYYKIFG